jgi:hypothetical protein
MQTVHEHDATIGRMMTAALNATDGGLPTPSPAVQQPLLSPTTSDATAPFREALLSISQPTFRIPLDPPDHSHHSRARAMTPIV